MNSGDIQEKRDLIYKEAVFIMENEELFKTGTFSLIKKIKNQIEINKIKLKDTQYVIKKKTTDIDNIYHYLSSRSFNGKTYNCWLRK